MNSNFKTFQNNQSRSIKIILMILCGLMLGLSFPPVPTGILAYIAFLPFFILFNPINTFNQAFRYSYFIFFIFNLVTLYWVGGFIHAKDYYIMIAGLLLLIAHPFFFFLPVAAWIWFKRTFGYTISLFVFPLFWVAFEYLHSLTEIAFPWLTIANSQTYDLQIIQFVSITGSYGISFLVLYINVFIYLFFLRITSSSRSTNRLSWLGLAIVIVILYIVPKMYGKFILSVDSRVDQIDSSAVSIALIQPNIDPFEKWEGHGLSQLYTLQAMTDEATKRNVDLVIWPETAIPFYILAPMNQYYFYKIKEQVDSLNINLLTGIPDIIYYKQHDKFPKSSKINDFGNRYETFNSSMLLQPHKDSIQKYAKILLVPFAERVPFSEELSFLNAMHWNFGLGGWGIGRDTTVFFFNLSENRNVRFSNLICYESIYPGFTAQFVKKGAEFITIITNDSWWGNTSGVYQHMQFAILRAVENRRWIARCANGGISCFIDPYGNVKSVSEFNTKTILRDFVLPKNELTFYTEHIDWFAKICTIISLFIITALIGNSIYRKIRMRSENEIH